MTDDEPITYVLSTPRAMTEGERFVMENFITGGTNGGADRIRATIALQWAKQQGCYAEVLAIVMARRKAWLVWVTRTQRDWQTKVSRRPQRGNHHDSWSIREGYVRCAA